MISWTECIVSLLLGAALSAIAGMIMRRKDPQTVSGAIYARLYQWAKDADITDIAEKFFCLGLALMPAVVVWLLVMIGLKM
jgi:hypothetical protein